MANTNNPKGLFPLQPPCGKNLHLYKADTTHNIFRFDPVVLLDTGKVGVAPKGDNVYMLGVAVGFLDSERAGLGNSLEVQPYYLKNQEGPYVVVCDDPEQLYVVQADTGGTNLLLSNVGNSCGYDWIQTGSGDTTTGVSKAELDQSDVAADTAGSLRIVDIVDNVSNTTGNWAKWVVKINHAQGAPTAVGQNI